MLVSFSGVASDGYVMSQISNLSSEEFVQAAEYLSSANMDSGAHKRALQEKIRSKMENEYNRTKIDDRGNESKK
jgi:hypothetical protein